MSNSTFDCVFRADGGPGFGFGHLRRCFVLAEALKRRGIGRIAFASRTKEVAKKVLKGRFPIIEIPADRDEVNFFSPRFRKIQSKLLVVDSCHIKSGILAALKKILPVVIFDDTGNHPYYPVDGIINYNVHAKTLRYRCSNGARLFLGTRYTPIDSALRSLVHRKKNPHKPRLYISLSGMLPAKCLRKAVRVLNKLDGLLKVDITSSLEHNQVLRKKIKQVRWLPFQQTGNIMAKADIALCAAGVTSYELAFLGIPALVTIIPGNHEPMARWLAKAGVAKNIGWFMKLRDQEIVDEIKHFVHDKRGRDQMSRSQRRFIDGLGSDRLADKLIQYWIGK